MKESKLYICDYCGTSYKIMENCQECENNHKIPTQFVSSKYSPIKVDKQGYPKTIRILFNDGTEVEYKR